MNVRSGKNSDCNCNQLLKILSLITEEFRASASEETWVPRHVKLFDVYLDHTQFILPVQTPEVLHTLFRVAQEIVKFFFYQSFHEDGVPVMPTSPSTCSILPSVCTNTFGNDTVGFHQSREPHFIEVRLCVRPWNQRRNRCIPVSLWQMKQNPGSLSFGNSVQPPSRMRRKTHRIIGKVLTWAVEPFLLERSSCRKNTPLLRRCIQLRREGQGS